MKVMNLKKKEEPFFQPSIKQIKQYELKHTYLYI